MKISCDVIRDLYLLYENGEASEGTVKLVEEHLAECPDCREFFENSREEIKIDEILEEVKLEEVKEVQNGLGKVKKRWKLSLISVLMVIPLVGFGILLFHQCTGAGVAFTNIDEIQSAKKFMRLIEEEKYDTAIKMLDYSIDYESVIEVLDKGEPKLEALYGKNPTKEEYTKRRNEKLLDYLLDFQESGYSISDVRLNYVYRVNGNDGNRCWCVQIAFVESASDGFVQDVIVEFVCKDGRLDYNSAMEEERLSAFGYAMTFYKLWNLDEIPTYEEYLKME